MVVTQVRAVHVVAAVLSLVLMSFAVMRVSWAAFTDTTLNAGSNWTAGDVVLADDDSDAVLFSTRA